MSKSWGTNTRSNGWGVHYGVAMAVDPSRGATSTKLLPHLPYHVVVVWVNLPGKYGAIYHGHNQDSSPIASP